MRDMPCGQAQTGEIIKGHGRGAWNLSSAVSLGARQAEGTEGPCSELAVPGRLAGAGLESHQGEESGLRTLTVSM